MKIEIEVTDTFGGEANYCWCRRFTVETNSEELTERQIIRRAKKIAGISCRHRKTSYVNMIRLDFAPAWLACMFITFDS